MDRWDIEKARDLYVELKRGRPGADDLVAAADLIRELVDKVTDHSADTYTWDDGTDP